MKRVTLNFIVDFVAFLTFLGIAITGFVIKFALPPGTGGRGQAITGGRGLGAGERITELWSMGRHDWGDLHFVLSVIFIVLVLVHVVLHWTWIKCYVKSLFAPPWKPEES